MEVKEILKDLVSFNTIRDQENKQIMDYIENYLKKYNFNTKRIDKCLIASNDNNPKVGFLGHTDTVDYESWDGNPFELTQDNDTLTGLGACDMKGGIASILSAISELDLNQNKMSLYLTYDEETDFNGINAIKDLVTTENIIVGESTNNIPVIGTKGIIAIYIDFYGVKSHSSTPDIGKNAIYEAISFIEELRKFHEKIIKPVVNNSFEVPYTTMNIGMINGGETINSVPGKCSITIDFRVIEKDQIDLILENINKMLEKYDSKITKCYSIDPKLNNRDISFLEELTCKKETKCYITEGSFINSNFIILGPGPDTSHQKNEHISYESLKKTVDLYKKIIEHYNKK